MRLLHHDQGYNSESLHRSTGDEIVFDKYDYSPIELTHNWDTHQQQLGACLAILLMSVIDADFAKNTVVREADHHGTTAIGFLVEIRMVSNPAPAWRPLQAVSFDWRPNANAACQYPALSTAQPTFPPAPRRSAARRRILTPWDDWPRTRIAMCRKDCSVRRAAPLGQHAV